VSQSSWPPDVPQQSERSRDQPDGVISTEDTEAGDIGWEGEVVIKCDVWYKKDCGSHP
jgi:hypothetical protein